jgi:hypothetical protein
MSRAAQRRRERLTGAVVTERVRSILEIARSGRSSAWL